ncbi:MAG: carbohydrate ABC transporter permease [Lactobacillus sp.]|jgi:multiple sugar transport system permease protein|nr:carbohydrate ABC transporter permease [Lactobacillus sp.]
MTETKTDHYRGLLILGKIIKYVILVVGAIIMLLPFLWMLSTSLKNEGATMVMPPQFIVKNPIIDNFKAVITDYPMLTFLKNSVIVAVFTTVFQILNGALAGFAFGRMHFKGRNILFLIVLSTMMIPSQVTMIPQFVLLKYLGWLNSYLGLVVPNVFGAFSIFLMKQAFENLPDALEEAAAIDGANLWTIFWKVDLPQTKATIATLTIFNFMQSWNNYLWPLIVTNSDSKATLPLGLALMQGQYSTNWNLVMAGVVISVVPILMVYLIAQRQFIQGMTMSSAVK